MTRDSIGGYGKALIKEKKFLLENFPKNSVVLDVGCGFGRVVKTLAPISKKIIGIDNDEEAITKSKEELRGNENVEIKFGDAENLDFDDQSFDVVTCLGATPSNFGKTREKIFLEIKRVLKKKGLFLTSVYNDDALKERLSYYEKYYPGQYKVNRDTGYVVVCDKFVSEQFSKEQITNILEENGFEVLEVIKEGVFNIVRSNKK